MLASLLRIILLTATLKILERGLDKGPIIDELRESGQIKENETLEKERELPWMKNYYEKERLRPIITKTRLMGG